MGFEFPLSGKIYSQDRLGIGRISGVLYACDLMGGWLAGMMVGVFLLPVFGLFKTFMLAATLKLSSLILLGTPSKSKLRVSP
jgi:hypothetical protein